MRIGDIMKRFGVGRGTVKAWIAANELRAVNVSREPGSRRPRWWITPEALAAFEATRTAGVPAPKAKRRKSAGDVVEFY
jgi:transposase